MGGGDHINNRGGQFSEDIRSIMSYKRGEAVITLGCKGLMCKVFAQKVTLAACTRVNRKTKQNNFHYSTASARNYRNASQLCIAHREGGGQKSIKEKFDVCMPGDEQHAQSERTDSVPFMALCKLVEGCRRDEDLCHFQRISASSAKVETFSTRGSERKSAK